MLGIINNSAYGVIYNLQKKSHRAKGYKMKTVSIQVERTKNYKEFKKGKFQPEKRTKASKGLMASIKGTNGNKLCPAIIHNGEILDGHRRLQACEAMDVPFYYVKINDVPAQAFVQQLNSTAKQWSSRDYISSHAGYISEYAELEEILSVHKLPVSFMASMCDITSIMIQNGATLVWDRVKLRKQIKIYKKLKSIYNPLVSTNHIHRALGKLFKLPDFNPDIMFDQVSKAEKDDYNNLAASETHFFVKELIDIYNYKSSSHIDLFGQMKDMNIVR